MLVLQKLPRAQQVGLGFLGSGNGNFVPGEVGTASPKLQQKQNPPTTLLILENKEITAFMLFWAGGTTEIISSTCCLAWQRELFHHT